MTDSSIYLNFPKALRRLNAYRIVKGPILPIYIVSMMRILPSPLNLGVIPNESPTVLKAEKTSNNTSCIVAHGSLIKRMNDEIKITVKLKEMTVNALVTKGEGSVLSKMLTVSLAAILDFKKANITPIVLVLTPPPVEPGEAPINIRKIKRYAEAALSELKSIVLKPAVRDVTV